MTHITNTHASNTWWHTLTCNEVYRRLDSSEVGLDETQAEVRLKHYGPNTIEVQSKETIPFILLRQLQNPLIYVLFISTLFALLLNKWTDAAVIFAVIAINAGIGFFQEYKAHTIIRALCSLIPQKALVMRGGITKQLPTHQIVPGDLILLEVGDRIPADIRLISVKNLQCDESTLTGESLPVFKRVDAEQEDVPIPERKCMAFNGTFVTSGRGYGVVVATGPKTEVGKLSQLLEKVPLLETPMSTTIRKMAQLITYAIFVTSICLFFVGVLRGSTLFDAALSAVALAVAAIPEGLPAVITIAASVGVRRMAKRAAIIRQLPAVEAVGSATVICTDKTGTLTYNEMTVQQVWSPCGLSFVSGAGYALEGHFYSATTVNLQELQELFTAALLCSDAILEESPKGLLPVGDPTEIALIVGGRKLGLYEKKIRGEWIRKDVIPFESEKRLMATLNVSTTRQAKIFLKGAPEEILALCNQSHEGKLIDQSLVLQQVQEMARSGMRVLAIATKEVPDSSTILHESDIKGGCTLLGLVGMIDPPRKEVYQALKSCHEAGIDVKMVTGDHPLTAEAIARDLGILRDGVVVTGRQLATFTEHDWQHAARYVQVFARVAPEHKLKLVEVLQNAGHVVVMTGDGVNDAPALKRADIGIAMGVKGTSVAKETADIILADDNFASIEAAVEEGRRVHDNLLKSLTFILPTSFGQALVILIAMLTFPVHNGTLLHPMLPVQILWVNLVVAVALSLPLAFECAESDSMRHPPRKIRSLVLGRYLLLKTLAIAIVMAVGTIGLFIWEYYSALAVGVDITTSLAEAQTMAVTSMMLFQVFYLFNCRSLRHSLLKTHFFSNTYIFLGVGLVLVAQLLFVYLPSMNHLFGSLPLDLASWLMAGGIACLIMPIIALEKWLGRKQFIMK